MALFGGSSADQETASATQGQDVQDSASALQVSNIRQGKNSSVTVHATTTDFGAIEAAGDLARAAEGIAVEGSRQTETVTDALVDIGRGLNDVVSDLSADVTGAAVEIAEGGVFLADASLQTAERLGGLQADLVRDLSRDNLTAVGDLLVSSERQVREALGYAERAASAANAAADRRAARADARADRALDTARDVFYDSADQLAEASARQGDLVRDVALFQADLVDEVVTTVSTGSQEQFEALGTFVERNTQISDQRVSDISRFAVTAAVIAAIAPPIIRSFTRAN